MSYEPIQNLSNDFSNLLENSEDYNVKIEVGKEPDIKEFKLHSVILSARSIYFKRALSSQWAKKEDGFFVLSKPNISPSVFGILINHIYTGSLSIENNNVSLVDIFIAADEIELLEVCQHLEKRLLKTESAWKFPNDFITICQHDNFTNLYEVALELVCKDPKIIFESKEFLKMGEDCLFQLLKCDNLRLEEIEIWEYLIKWGIKNTNSILDDDLSKWTPTDFVELEKTLHNCILHIRFFQMTPNEFSIVKDKFKNILPDGLADDVLQYFMNPKFKSSFKILPLRESAYPFDSVIINAKDAALIASWIDNKQGTLYRFKDIPFEFKLIYRASRDNFSINNFHKNCDNKGPTVVIIKVQDSGEIIGGYNPLDWRSVKLVVEDEISLPLNSHFYNNYKCKTSKSFIFSLLSSTNGAIPVLSKVSSKKEAIIWCKSKGPCFGLQDLWIQNNSSRIRSCIGKSKQHSYETRIINRETFEIEEYEVFQIIDNRFSFKKMFIGTAKIFHKIFKFGVGMFKIMFQSIIGMFGIMFRSIEDMIHFFTNLDKEVYISLLKFVVILSVLSLLAFAIYELITASAEIQYLVGICFAAFVFMCCKYNC